MLLMLIPDAIKWNPIRDAPVFQIVETTAHKFSNIGSVSNTAREVYIVDAWIGRNEHVQKTPDRAR